MEKIPVIIPAYNEEALIRRTLESLDPRQVEPLVVVNGSSDGTAQAVRDFGLQPLVLDEAGKLPAMQAGLRSLGERALGPVLFTDADTVAIRPKLWARAMAEAVDTDGPSYAAGVIGVRDTGLTSGVIRGVRRMQLARRAQQAGEPIVAGANMAVRLHTPELLETVLALPHVWPGEDRLVTDTIAQAGGTGKQLTNIDSMVLASGRYGTSLVRRILHGQDSMLDAASSNYGQRRAAGAVGEYTTSRHGPARLVISEVPADIKQ